ncbi:hypothetical protein WISP_36918 [Willisornis vidua]|uniref:Uncharacterized protein n=1 Tax=Willisornis vidua TaxID=1566151 RepID=A0ABQ9DMR4_9PASS|nr:hypothetical protein WISP_36918 [Willisornis vidua]
MFLKVEKRLVWRQDGIQRAVPRSYNHHHAEWFVLEGTFKFISFQSSGRNRDTFHYTTLLQALSSLALNTPEMGWPQLLWGTCYRLYIVERDPLGVFWACSVSPQTLLQHKQRMGKTLSFTWDAQALRGLDDIQDAREYDPSEDGDVWPSLSLAGELTIGECLNEHSLLEEPKSDYSSNHVTSESDTSPAVNLYLPSESSSLRHLAFQIAFDANSQPKLEFEVCQTASF